MGADARVTVEGVVTAEAGRIGLPPQIAIQDATGAIVVKLPDGAQRPARGAVVRVTGKLSEPYGQLEVRPAAAGDVSNRGPGVLPDPLPGSGASLGEAIEARLIVLAGTLDAPLVREASGDLVLRLVDASGVAFRARAARAARIEPTVARPGARLRLSGIVGQRASRKGALDGYRLWLRDAADLIVTAVPRPTASPAPSPAPATGMPDAAVRPIAAILRLDKGSVRVDGVVTIPATLLDASGRRAIVQDASAAVEVLLPVGQAAPRPGTRLLVDGEIGTAYGAPRIRAFVARVLGTVEIPAPRALAREPGSADEGELVRIAGSVADLKRLGDRWRAEVRTSGGTIVVAGLAGAGIPAVTMAEGAIVTVVGVIRRPHPAATDRRFAVVPRGPGDVRANGAAGTAAGRPAGGGAASRSPGVFAGRPEATSDASVIDADLATLPGLEGARVRVGGLVVALDADRVLVDDGTATGGLRLTGDAAALLLLLEPGDAISAVGRVALTPTGAIVEVDEPASLVRLGDLGEAVPLDPGGPGLAAGSGAGDGSASPPPAPAGSASPPAVGPGPDPGAAGPGDSPLLAGVGLTLVASGGWASLAALRRRRDRRRLSARIAARIAVLTAPPPPAPPEGPAAAGRDPSAREPA